VIFVLLRKVHINSRIIQPLYSILQPAKLLYFSNRYIIAVFSAKSTARAMQDPENQMPHRSEFKEGDHFPAMEAPELLVGDLRKFFRKLQLHQ